MTLSVLSRVEQVTTSLDGPGPIELFAVRRAGTTSAELLVEAYADGTVVAAGELAVWDLNQALSAVISRSSQARRLALREDGRGRCGYLDLVTTDGDEVSVVAAARDGERRAAYRGSAAALARDLNVVLRHYLDMTRLTPRTIVLPDASPAQAGGAAWLPSRTPRARGAAGSP